MMIRPFFRDRALLGDCWVDLHETLLLCCKLPKLLRECDDVINWWRHHLIWWSEAECVFVNSFSRRLSSWIARNFAVILRVTQLSRKCNAVISWWRHHQISLYFFCLFVQSFSQRQLERFWQNLAVMSQMTKSCSRMLLRHRLMTSSPDMMISAFLRLKA